MIKLTCTFLHCNLLPFLSIISGIDLDLIRPPGHKTFKLGGGRVRVINFDLRVGGIGWSTRDPVTGGVTLRFGPGGVDGVLGAFCLGILYLAIRRFCGDYRRT